MKPASLVVRYSGAFLAPGQPRSNRWNTWRSLLLLLLFVLPWSGAARQPAEPPLLEQVVNGVESLPQVKAASDHLQWFDSHRYGAPYVDEMDVRFGGITENDNEYAVRIKPTNPFLFAAARNMGRVLRERAALAYRQALEDVLFERYESWLELWFRSQSIRQLEKADAWRHQWLTTLQQLAGDEEFDPEELLDLEIDRIDLQSDLLKEMDKLDDELQSFLILTNHGAAGDSLSLLKAPQLMKSGFPYLSATKMKQKLDSLEADSSVVSLEVEEIRMEIAQSRASIAMEKLDWDVGFVQPEWDNTGPNRFSMRVGIGIPLFRRNRIQMQNRQLDLFEETTEQLALEMEWEKEKGELYRDIQSLTARLLKMETLAARLAEMQDGFALMEGKNSREILLKWLKASEKLEKQALEDQFLLLSAYLQYLKLTGRLAYASSGQYFNNIWQGTSY